MARLLWEHEGQVIKDYPFPMGSVAIGRRKESSIVFTNPEVSSTHARIDKIGTHYMLWKLRFRLLMMNVDFAGVAEPMQAVLLTQRIYLDGLTKDACTQRFLTVRNAVIAVIWSIMQDLEGVEPPAESAQPKTH